MRNFNLTNKIVWRKGSEKNLSENFYPSIYTDVCQKEAFLKETFRLEIVEADENKIKDLFFPLYAKAVAEKPDYTLNKEKVLTDILNKISQRKYELMFIYFHDTLIFSWLFCIKNGGLYMAYRAYNKNFDQRLSRKYPVSYWAEKILYNYAEENSVSFLSHGKDSHPFIGKTRLGLPLYKLKTGMQPKKPAPTDKSLSIKEVSENFFKNGLPSLFFYNEDSEGYFKNCRLYYPAQSLDSSYLKEFEKVMNWSKIEFEAISY